MASPHAPHQDSSQDCEESVGQSGTLSWVDLTLPKGKALHVHVTTNVPGQTADQGFFVRPTRLTRDWGKAAVSKTTASFYLASTGHFSVEFVSDAAWKNYKVATEFDALMLFVNPVLELPSTKTLTAISHGTKNSAKYTDLDANRAYVCKAGVVYDWGRDHVFKVHDNTAVYFEPSAHVRARIVHTEKKVKNVRIIGYGTLDVHYTPKDEIMGVSDDRTRQNIGIFGKHQSLRGDDDQHQSHVRCLRALPQHQRQLVAAPLPTGQVAVRCI